MPGAESSAEQPVLDPPAEAATCEPVHAKRHPNQRARAIYQMILLRVQIHPLDFVSSQQSLAKGARLSSSNRLGQKQPQVVTAAASLQIGQNVLTSQRAGQVTQALPALGGVCIQDDEPGLALLIEQQVGAQRDLPPQVVNRWPMFKGSCTQT
jgi:hypothetical protein